MLPEELRRRLPAVVAEHWRSAPSDVGPLGGAGMNSATARLRLGGATYVAKWVPDAYVAGARRGLAEARLLADRGLATGAPLPTADGRLGVDLAGGFLALLAWVPGDALVGEGPQDQLIIGRTLARAHTLGRPEPAPTRRFFGWFDERSTFLDAEPGLREAVTAVLTEYDALPPLTWGLLHTDPAPEAFRHDPDTGETGLVDWAGATRGPLLYDVTSAVMYLGGLPRAQPFLDTYLRAGVLPADELDHLPALWRFRGAVQAAYFADRIARHDLTGIHDPAENTTGLADGRAMLFGAG